MTAGMTEKGRILRYRMFAMWIDRIWTLILPLALLCSCGREGMPEEVEDTAVELSVTRSGGASDGEHSYRVLLFDRLTGQYSGRSGTYYYDFGESSWDGVRSGVLVPCAVDAAGGRVGGRDAAHGLYAPAGSYGMVIVSPAVDVGRVSPSRYGFRYSRMPEADAEPLRIADIAGVSIKGRGELHGAVVRDTLHVDDSKVLRERRSKLGFVFRCGEDVGEVVLSEVSLRNVIDTAFWYPAGGCFIGETIGSKVLMSGDMVCRNGDAPLNLPLGSNAESDGRYMYVLSQDYSATDAYGEPLYPLPELHIEFGGEVVMDIPIGYDFQPHYRYVYTVTVNSLYVHLSLSVASWDIDEDTGGIDAPPLVEIVFPIGGWEDGGSSGGVIE